MSKKTMKILTTIITMLLIVSMGVPVVFGAKIGNVEIKPDQTNTENITGVGNKLMGVLQVVGILTAVIILMVLGIKYMMGSAEEKAEYKKTMMPYIIGAILIFAATTIANAVYNFVTGI